MGNDIIREMLASNEAGDRELLQHMKSMEYSLYASSREQKKVLRELALSLVDEWIDEVEKKGTALEGWEQFRREGRDDTEKAFMYWLRIKTRSAGELTYLRHILDKKLKDELVAYHDGGGE